MEEEKNEKPKYDMTRGMSQVLYNYLPGKTFDLKGGINIGIVERIKGESAKNLKDTGKLFKQIKKYTAGWDKDHLIGFDNFDSKRDSYIFEKPKYVSYNIFPLTFKCTKCKRVYDYKDLREVEKKNPKLICLYGEECKGTKLKQVYQVAIHQCGKIQGLHPIRPEKCECDDWQQNIILDDKRSQKIADFRWVCKKCHNEAEVKYMCWDCEENDKNMTIIPHRASKSYYIHSIKCVDVAENNYENGWKDDVKKYLNIESDGISTNNLAAIYVLKKQKENMLPETYQLLLKQLQPKNEQLYDIDNIQEDAGTSLHEYLEIYNKNVMKKCTIGEKINELKDYNPPRSYSLKEDATKFKSLGIKDIVLIEDFPVVTAMFGWSRSDIRPEVSSKYGTRKTSLNSFKYNSDEKGKIPIFVDNGKCEAVMFEIDPLRIIDWLEKNKVEVNISSKDEMTARYWILKNIGNAVNPQELLQIHNSDYYIYSLIHTMSHIMMKGIAGISGFELIGLSEYMFPASLSFVIYSNRTDFSIGGMHTLFETQLDLLFNRILSTDFITCMHDPLCKLKEGACHACLYLPEIACSNFNRNLSRKFIYGSPDVKGFWEGMF